MKAVSIMVGAWADSTRFQLLGVVSGLPGCGSITMRLRYDSSISVATILYFVSGDGESPY